MAIRVTETIYYVLDLDSAIDFYTTKLGYELVEREDWGWAALSIDGKSRIGLELFIGRGFDVPDEMPSPRIAMQTDDIEGEILRLKQSGVKVDKLIGEPGHMRSVSFYDEDGNAFFLWDDGSGLA